jgi:hypothetical protein
MGNRYESKVQLTLAPEDWVFRVQADKPNEWWAPTPVQLAEFRKFVNSGVENAEFKDHGKIYQLDRIPLEMEDFVMINVENGTSRYIIARPVQRFKHAGVKMGHRNEDRVYETNAYTNKETLPEDEKLGRSYERRNGDTNKNIPKSLPPTNPKTNDFPFEENEFA